MLTYIAHRVALLIPLLMILSVISFIIIELPPGDFLSTQIKQMEASGIEVTEQQAANLRQFYGLDKPLYIRYFKWIWNIIRYSNFGWSFQWQRPVSEVIGERIALTMVVSFLTLIFIWIVAIPIGIYSATHQYSFFDHIFTFFGFIGLATPNFLLALVLVWLSFAYFHLPITGLFSEAYIDAAWSLAKAGDMFKHVWIAVIVVGTAGTAGIIRVMRGCLLDELHKQYVVTARAKGVSERKLLFKYPVRVAINPLVSTIGWILPSIVSGMSITAIVLNLPTTGPVLLQALMYQDMYLAGSFVMLLSALTVIGSLISDILLAWLDPRIRYKGVSE